MPTPTLAPPRRPCPCDPDPDAHCFRESSCVHHEEPADNICCCCGLPPEAHTGCDCE